MLVGCHSLTWRHSALPEPDVAGAPPLSSPHVCRCPTLVCAGAPPPPFPCAFMLQVSPKIQAAVERGFSLQVQGSNIVVGSVGQRNDDTAVIVVVEPNSTVVQQNTTLYIGLGAGLGGGLVLILVIAVILGVVVYFYRR